MTTTGWPPHLSDDEHARLGVVFEAELRRGWIPKPSEVLDALGALRARDRT